MSNSRRFVAAGLIATILGFCCSGGQEVGTPHVSAAPDQQRGDAPIGEGEIAELAKLYVAQLLHYPIDPTFADVRAQRDAATSQWFVSGDITTAIPSPGAGRPRDVERLLRAGYAKDSRTWVAILFQPDEASWRLRYASVKNRASYTRYDSPPYQVRGETDDFAQTFVVDVLQRAGVSTQ